MSKPSIYIAPIVFLGVALYYIATLDGEGMVLSDSATYVTLAEALASGQGYTEVGSAGSPPYIKGPPLFPLLLGSVVYLFGRNFLLMRVMTLLFAFSALLLIYLFVRERGGEKRALLVTFIVGISPAFFSFSHKILSDIPYLCFVLLALHFLSRYSKEMRWLTVNGAVALVFITFVYFTRSLGFALFLAAPLGLVLHKPANKLHYKLLAAGAFTILCALPAVGWMARNAAVAQEATTVSYGHVFLSKQELNEDAGMLNSLADLLPRIHHNLYAYGHGTAELLFPALLPTRHHLLALTVAVPMLIGFVLTLWQGKEVGEIYVGVYGLILLLYPTPVLPRYLVPVLPFLLLYLMSGVETLARLLRPQLAGAVFAGLAVLLLAANLTAVAAPPSDVLDGMEDYQELAVWFRDRAAPDSIVMSRKPSVFYLWTGRKGVLFPFTADGRRIVQVICHREVDYVVQDSFSAATGRYLMPMLAKYDGAFAKVYSRNQTHLFQVNRTTLCKG